MFISKAIRTMTTGAWALISATLLPTGTPESVAHAEIKVGQAAPKFTLMNQDGKPFKLADRADKGWTVLYFFPKSGTPGCTQQACAFRDAIKLIHAQNAEVYGISADSIDAQKQFHSEHKLAFDLLADPQDEVIGAYGVKMFLISLAKRWTFILDPNLIVRHIAEDVDPLVDAKNTAAKLEELQKSEPVAKDKENAEALK